MLPMRLSRSRQAEFDEVSGHLKLFFGRRLSEIIGIGLIVIAICIALALVSWSVQDPSFNQAVNRPVSNLLGRPGAMLSDIMIQLFGLGAMAWLAPLGFWASGSCPASPSRRSSCASRSGYLAD